MKKILLLSTLLLAGCATRYHGTNDQELKFLTLSGEYSMSRHTYHILVDKLRTDNEDLRTDILPTAYDNVLRPEYKPGLWEYVLTKADINNDKKITGHEARCLEDDIWIEEF